MTPRRSSRMSAHRSRVALRRALLGAAGALALLVTTGARAQSPVLVSINTAGNPGDNSSTNACLSATGRYIAFTSNADDLVSQPSATGSDVFVRDLVTGVTELISTDPGGAPANSISKALSISADGRWVVFSSFATNLVPGGWRGLYVRDRATGLTTEETLAPGGGGVGNGFESGSISDDGRWLVFSSFSAALVPGDTNGAYDVFVRDRQSGVTTRVSVGPGGVQGDENSYVTSPASISADGRFVVFASFATNLVQFVVLQATRNVYLLDRQTGVLSLLNVSFFNQPSNADADRPTISADGHVAAFESAATNLVPSGPAVDVFVRDLQSNTLEAVSKTSLGAFGMLESEEPSLSGDGRWVAFQSSNGLVLQDTRSYRDVYLHDRLTGLTLPVSQDIAGGLANESSFVSQVSRDGHAVGFFSMAMLAPPDVVYFDYDTYLYDRLHAAPWTDLEGGIAGAFGVPVLLAEGPLTAGSVVVFALAAAPAGAPTVLVAGFSALNLPFKGGTLVLSLDVLVSLTMPVAGKIKLPVHWPAGVPAGAHLWLQGWFADGAAPQGFSASNTLLATTP